MRSIQPLSLFDKTEQESIKQATGLADQIARIIEALPFERQVETLNAVRTRLHQVSPFRDEPVDLVVWAQAERVEPNDYNPNTVHRPEMKLLETSIDIDHLTQPVVAHQTPGGDYTIADGEHRYKVVSSVKRIAKRLQGYVPLAVTRWKTREDQMASTVRHNRARGVHKLDGMVNIVFAMLDAGWTDEEIAKALGMDADEILRMKQASGGIAQAYTRPHYNRAWITDDGSQTLD